jgi:uncharacterized surface protein with fasciclin (FAS1) repeats
LNIGKYTTATQAPIVTQVLAATNVIYFVPNTAEAITNFTDLANRVSTSELGAILDYHVIPNSILHSTELVNGMVLQRVQGSDIYFTI